MGTKRRIAILGGGIIGLAAARRLALDGHCVTVLEADGFGAHASGRAGGILVRRAVQSSRVPGRLFYTRSIDAWPEWIAAVSRESGIEAPLWEGGDYCFFAHRERARRFACQLEEESHPGDWEELSEVPSFLSGTVAARDWRLFHFPREMCLDPRLALEALVAACVRAGVELKDGCPDPCVVRDGDGWRLEGPGGRHRADVLAVAAGPWSRAVLAGFGWKVETAPVRGQIALVPALYPGLSMLHLEDACYAVPRHGQTLIGATSEVGKWREETSEEGMESLQGRMRLLLPGLDLSGATSTWAGIRPRTRDRVPHLGWLEPGRLLVASGHYRSGISMAPLSGDTVAALVGERPVEISARELDPLRPLAGYRRE